MKNPARLTVLLAGAALQLILSPALSPGVMTDRSPGENRSPAGEIREIKGPVPPGKLFPWLLPVGSAIILASGVTVLVISVRRGRRGEPPHETALLSPEAALDLLESRFSGQREDVDLLYQDLSNLVRACLERRSGLPASRLTTDEILAETSGTGGSSPEPVQRLRAFLQRCDLVKFAGYGPSATEIEESFAAARSIIHSADASSTHDLH
jgi:hypothetical protein